MCSIKTFGLILYPVIFLFCNCGVSNRNSSAAHSEQITTDSSSSDEIVSAYTFAIGEYIKAVNKYHGTTFDTLFINNHHEDSVMKNAEGSMPEMKLPGMIEGTNVQIIKYNALVKKLVYRDSLVNLNLVGWVKKETSEFIIVTFHNGGVPQHNCHIHLSHRDGGQQLLDSLRFDYHYPAAKSKSVKE